MVTVSHYNNKPTDDTLPVGIFDLLLKWQKRFEEDYSSKVTVSKFKLDVHKTATVDSLTEYPMMDSAPIHAATMRWWVNTRPVCHS